MATLSDIQNDLEKIEIEFSGLVEKISKTFGKPHESNLESNGPKYNPSTMKWETEEIDLDWGEFEDIKEELKIDHDAFIVPALDYQRIERATIK